MADLRLVGVHDDGRNLLLSGPDGNIYLLPMDEALRTAVGKSANRPSRASQGSGTRMTPREIQSLIRAGSSASEVAEESGLSLEQVRRYEGPVLAEREHIADQARAVIVSAPAPHNDGYKSAFGEEPASLDEMVNHRLVAFGIDPKTLRWDAWRNSAGAWTISADFEPGTERPASSIGEPAPALWRFHSSRKDLHNANRWAQQLSELEPLDSPVPERRLSAVMDKPFDVEAGSPEAEAEPEVTAEVSEDGEDYPAHGGLLEMLRSRRGVRLGLDEDGDDELAAMLGTHIPGAHPRDENLYGAAGNESVEQLEEPQETSPKERLRSIPFLKLAPQLPEDDHVLDGVSDVSSDTREIVLSGEPSTALRPLRLQGEATATSSGSAQPSEDDEEAGPSDSEVAARLERKAAGKPKRSSVPSWDEIVFGTKGD
ncbi:DUF3071 domain-containing protein [Arthrobacter psychrolactophilus]|uniref:DUF3071 domain-containing protein n=1 Tax=Arthrobacter psychrolactophilus TaxID=92442 RepID=A0A2V5JL02_9MICC|nr:septation protein SepH [Arthrobacter psychrolactophilus]PYI38346.1 DUF3071 domain-containing protein [Arthrobacter psychrolactophilus]